MNSTSRILISGIALWAIALMLPVAHVGADALMHPGDIVLFISPVLVLIAALRFKNLEGALFFFPLSLLPALVKNPEIIGPSVYGLTEFTVLMVATGLYIQTATNRQAAVRVTAPSTSTPRIKTTSAQVRSLQLVTILCIALLLVPICSLHFSTDIKYQLALHFGDSSTRATIFIGLIIFVSWTYVMTRMLVAGFATELLNKHPFQARLSAFRNVHLRAVRVRSQLRWVILFGLIFGLLLIAVQSTGRGL